MEIQVSPDVCGWLKKGTERIIVQISNRQTLFTFQIHRVPILAGFLIHNPITKTGGYEWMKTFLYSWALAVHYLPKLHLATRLKVYFKMPECVSVTETSATFSKRDPKHKKSTITQTAFTYTYVYTSACKKRSIWSIQINQKTTIAVCK